MALTVPQLAAAMRLGGDGSEALEEPLNGIVTRLLAVGNAWTAKKADEAPEDVKDEAVIRMAAYLYDQPHAGMRMSFAAAWRNSGAAALVGPWIERGAVNVDEDDDA